ncbi:MAG: tetratricopeptide repeat protein [Bacteroidetes bacterium]|nr:tetratricopeptide repeat protein [Bacteroidota bacterium]
MKKITLIALLIFSIISLTAQEKKNANAFIKEGNEAYKIKNYDEAFSSFKQAIVLLEAENKVDTPLVYNTGYCAFKSKKYDEALPYFNKSIELNYKKSKPFIYKAQILSKNKNYKEMETTLNNGLKLYGEDKNLNKLMSSCFFKQGLVFYKEGNKIKKAANESGMNKTDPEKFKAEYAKANLKFQEALTFMEKAYTYNTKNKTVLKALINIYSNIEMKDKADKIKKELELL